jgi:periplasmic copper chaperone A
VTLRSPKNAAPVALSATGAAFFGLTGTSGGWRATCRVVNHNRTTPLLAPLAAAALVFSLAACGSDDDSSSDTVAETSQTTMADDMSSDTTMADTDMGDDADDDMDEMAEMPGGEATVGDITVTDVWVRQPAEGQTTSAAYGTITNNGDADITLVGGSVPFGATVEIHETLMGDDGTMQMEEREDGFVIAAGESFTLEPGGPHIMMLDIDPADFVGQIDITMVFDDGTELTVTAPVRPLDGMDMDDMDDMDDDMTETTDG